ncbi:longistatin-like [Tachypleus tridentatus]|uniref:longistatin-like n=1 Tax=Tachypleus tridentatus TaxID=6853 RepID=UPI003FD528DE
MANNKTIRERQFNFMLCSSVGIVFLLAFFIFHLVTGNTNVDENKNDAKATELRRKWGAEEIIRDLDHIKEDVNNLMELQEAGTISSSDALFYFFRMHDFDDNKVLDGLELITAVRHSFDRSSETESQYSLDEFIPIVDSFYKYDMNNDGFLTYPEIRMNLGDTIQTEEPVQKYHRHSSSS